MPNPYTNTYMPNGFENQDPNNVNPMMQNTGGQQTFQNQMNTQGQQIANNPGIGGGMGGSNPMALALALRGQSGNVQLPAGNTPQMTGVAGMGNSMGTGLTQTSNIGFNPNGPGSFGIKY